LSDGELLLGTRLRNTRRSKGWTLREIAERAGITESFLSQLERDVSSPSIATLQRICRAMGVSIGEVLEEGQPVARLVRASDRRTVQYPGLKARDEFLTADLHGRLQLILSTVEPGGGTGAESYAHESDEECVLILEGSLDLWVGEEHYRLEEGDALVYPSRTPHRNTNNGDRPTRILFCLTPPSF
jgi:transcriptional regulator with XRE-family HTH domain